MSAADPTQPPAEPHRSGLEPHARRGHAALASDTGQETPLYEDSPPAGSVVAAADQPNLVRTRQREDFQEAHGSGRGLKPGAPTKLTGTSWKYTIRRTLTEFSRDQCTDLAAALTYYAVLSIFPALIAFVSLLSLVGEEERTQEFLLGTLDEMVEDEFMETIETVVDQVTAAPGAGLGLAVGILVALWTASNYVNAFSRAMNRIHDAEEGRSFLKLRPLLYGVTAALIVLVAAASLMLVVSGPLAEAIGNTVGLGETAVTVWNWATPVVLLLVAAAAIALLYYVTPNSRQPGAKWVSAGALLAIVVMVLATVGVGIYIANFANYEATYGALAGVIIFLFWIYIMNVVLLLGAEFDAELERTRQLQGGIEAERTLMLPPRDTSGVYKRHGKYEELVAAGRALRISEGKTADPNELWRR